MIEYIGFYKIEIGRNQDENDQLLSYYKNTTNALDTLWFHLSEETSPHGFVSIQREKKKEGKQDRQKAIRRCAVLVKSFSKSKREPSVEIVFLPIQYVRLTSTEGTVEVDEEDEEHIKHIIV